ncbi:hypothetical protein [Burkholderia sp. L27(2015)]|uniref:hypothetical protein n=1 Tax=Burkholderia sp. L27(2015) TaxID=1641858 RepID=UPI00131E08B9|nr:hypothetical protein [Burkholderia sp. L27(2015)]
MHSIFPLSNSDLNLILRALANEHFRMEADGKRGSDDHRRLRYLEDELGTMVSNDRDFEIRVVNPK